MANSNKVPGTYISDKETRELVQLLTTFREYIVSHEARIEAIEEFINESIKAQIALAQEEADGTTEAEGAFLPEDYDGPLGLTVVPDESTDDPEEG